MKRIFLLILTALPAMVFAQEGKYVVKGTIGTYNAPAKVYLRYSLDGKTAVTDSTTLKNGAFAFSGIVGALPSSAYLLFSEKGTGPSYKDYRLIYLEPGTITITSPANDLKANAIVRGPKTNTDNENFQLAYKPINDGQKVIDDKEKAATPEQLKSPEFIKQVKLAQKELDAKEVIMNKTFIQDHPDSYISLNALENYAYSADYVDIAPLFEGLSPAIKQSDPGKKFAERLPKLKSVALGAMAPEFAEVDTSGKMINLSSFRGKYVLVDFWASWCGPCRHENPNVVKAFNRFKNQKFTILGVSLDRPNAKDKWLAAIHKDGLKWTQVSDLKFWDSKVAGLYAVRGIPQNFLIDPNGRIIGKNLRGDDLEAKLEELFGKI
jgi:peroxiredoxin